MITMAGSTVAGKQTWHWRSSGELHSDPQVERWERGVRETVPEHSMDI